MIIPIIWIVQTLKRLPPKLKSILLQPALNFSNPEWANWLAIKTSFSSPTEMYIWYQAVCNIKYISYFNSPTGGPLGLKALLAKRPCGPGGPAGLKAWLPSKPGGPAGSGGPASLEVLWARRPCGPGSFRLEGPASLEGVRVWRPCRPGGPLGIEALLSIWLDQNRIFWFFCVWHLFLNIHTS